MLAHAAIAEEDGVGNDPRTGIEAAQRVIRRQWDDATARQLRDLVVATTIRRSKEKAVIVEQLLPAARAGLVTIAADAPLLDAARLLRSGTDIIVVCRADGAVAGVITKTDVVARISMCQGTACTTAAAVVMSSDVLLCAPSDLLQDVWSKMKARGLKNIPVGDADGRPLGVLNARDVLGFLLKDVEVEESLLRDYVMGVGYH